MGHRHKKWVSNFVIFMIVLIAFLAIASFFVPNSITGKSIIGEDKTIISVIDDLAQQPNESTAVKNETVKEPQVSPEKKPEQKIETQASGRTNVIILLKEPSSQNVAERKSLINANQQAFLNAFPGFVVKYKYGYISAIAGSALNDDLSAIRSNRLVQSVVSDSNVLTALAQSVPMTNAAALKAISVNGVPVTGAGRSVCLVDTGIDYNHQYLGDAGSDIWMFDMSNIFEAVSLESNHSYNPNTNEQYPLAFNTLSSVSLHFSKINLESGRDFIYIQDLSGYTYDTITGDRTDYWTAEVPSDSVVVKFVTDASNQEYGFVLDNATNLRPTLNQSIQNSHIIIGPNLISGDNNSIDDNGHGTAMAGIIVSNHTTYRGVAPDANVIGVKVLDSQGSSPMSRVAAGIEWCFENKDVYNISVISLNFVIPGTVYGGPQNPLTCPTDLFTGIALASTSYNIPIVAPSGNGGFFTGIADPACQPGIISVGAITKAGDVWGSTNVGNDLDVLAPGVGITTTEMGTDSFASVDGTSIAAAHVAGVIALIQQYGMLYQGSIFTVEQIHNAIRNGGIKINYNSNGVNINITKLDALMAADGVNPLLINSYDIATDFSTYSKSGLQNLAGVRIGKTGYGLIEFSQPVDIAGVDIDKAVEISFNKIYVNTTQATGLNKQASITFYYDYINTTNFFGVFHVTVEPIILKDGSLCQGCARTGFVADASATYSVPQFSSYTTEPNAKLSVYDEHDLDNTTDLYPGQQIKFYADYRTQVANIPISDAPLYEGLCGISFSDEHPSIIHNMDYNTSSQLWEYNRSFFYPSFYYSVNYTTYCKSQDYESLLSYNNISQQWECMNLTKMEKYLGFVPEMEMDSSFKVCPDVYYIQNLKLMNSSGSYDCADVNSSLFKISKDDITIDGQGARIIGNFGCDAVQVPGTTHWTIKNISLSGFENGILITEEPLGHPAKDYVISDVNLSFMSAGIKSKSKSSSTNNLIKNVMIRESIMGMQLLNTRYSQILSSSIAVSGVGINMIGANGSALSRGMIISGNNISHAGAGMTLACFDCTITDNIFNKNGVGLFMDLSNFTLFSQNFTPSMIYHNNFTESLTYNVVDNTPGNNYSININGKWQGNSWDDVWTKPLKIYDGDYDSWGDEGIYYNGQLDPPFISEDYPYNEANGGLVSGNITDWGPATPFNIHNMFQGPCVDPLRSNESWITRPYNDSDAIVITEDTKLCKGVYFLDVFTTWNGTNYTTNETGVKGAIYLANNNITLDCNNAVLIGVKNSSFFNDFLGNISDFDFDVIFNESRINTTGIYIMPGRDRVTVKNCILINFEKGMDLFKVEDSIFENNLLFGVMYGYNLINSSSNIINKSLIFKGKNYSIYSQGSQNNFFDHLFASNILFNDSSNRNTITGSIILGPSGDNNCSINISHSSINVIYRNFFWPPDNGYSVCIDDPNNNNRLYRQNPQTLRNEGNLWLHIFGGHPLNIFDLDNDGYGDSGPDYPYNVSLFGGINDTAPIVSKGIRCVVPVNNYAISHDTVLCSNRYQDALNAVMNLYPDLEFPKFFIDFLEDAPINITVNLTPVGIYHHTLNLSALNYLNLDDLYSIKSSNLEIDDLLNMIKKNVSGLISKDLFHTYTCDENNSFCDPEENGLLIMSNNSKVLDCNGTILKGNTSGIAINMTGNATTLKNCDLRDWSIGVLDTADKNRIFNNSLINDSVGLKLMGLGLSINLMENNFTDNDYGFHWIASSTPFNRFFGNRFVYHPDIIIPTSLAIKATIILGDINQSYWSDLYSKGLQILDRNHDGYGDAGLQYPYNQTNGGLVDNVEDYLPIIVDSDNDTVYDKLDCAPNDPHRTTFIPYYIPPENYSIEFCNITGDPVDGLFRDLEGNGALPVSNNSVINCNGFEFEGDGSGTGLKIENKKNVTIKNCDFYNYANLLVINNSHDIIIDPSNFQGTGVENNKIENSNNIVFDDVSFSSFNIALKLVNVSNATINRSLFMDNYAGIMAPMTDFSDLSKNINITNSWFELNNISIYCVGFSLIIEGNTISPGGFGPWEDTSGVFSRVFPYFDAANFTNTTGIAVLSADDTTRIVSNNIGYMYTGIMAIGVTNITSVPLKSISVSNNNIVNSTNGIAVIHANVSGNKLINMNETAIFAKNVITIYFPLDGTSVIDNNNITNSAFGITINNSNGSFSISRNILTNVTNTSILSSNRSQIFNNTIRNSDDADNDGIILVFGDNNIITGNNMIDNNGTNSSGSAKGTTAITASGGSDNIIEYNLIRNLSGNGDGPTIAISAKHSHNNKFHGNTIINTSGIIAAICLGTENSTNITFLENSCLDTGLIGLSAALYSYNSKNISSISDDLLSVDNYSFVIINSSVMGLNATFNKSKVYVDDNSSLTIKWFADVNVTNMSGVPLRRARVAVFNGTNDRIEKQYTPANGVLSFNITEYRQNGTGKYYETNHTINASKWGAKNTTVFNMSEIMFGNSDERNRSARIYYNIKLDAVPYPCVNLSNDSTWYGVSEYNGNLMLDDDDVILCNDTYYWNTTGEMITFDNPDWGIELDCNGSTIIGNGSGTAIYSNYPENKILYCSLSNFTKGIVLDNNSYYGEVRYNLLNFMEYGIYDNHSVRAPASYRNFIYYNKFNNSYFGIALLNSSDGIDGNFFYNISNTSIKIIGNNSEIADNEMVDSSDADNDGVIYVEGNNNEFTYNRIRNIDGFYMVFLYYSNNSMFTNNIFENVTGMISSKIVAMQHSSNNTFVNDRINDNDNFNYELNLDSLNNTVINVSFNKSQINVVDSNSFLFVKWFLDVKTVEYPSLNLLQNVSVNATNVSGASAFSKLTNSNGDIERQNVTEFIAVNPLGITIYEYQTNYTINASKTGYVYIQKSLNLTNSTEIVMRMPTSHNVVVSQVKVTKTTANISAATTLEDNMTLNYGKTSALGNISTYAGYDYNYTFNITGLTEGTKYYYNITACDVLGRCTSTQNSFITDKTVSTSGTSHGGGGGGGAAYIAPNCTSTCDAWSACINNKQTRTCHYAGLNCKQYDEIEDQDCAIVEKKPNVLPPQPIVTPELPSVIPIAHPVVEQPTQEVKKPFSWTAMLSIIFGVLLLGLLGTLGFARYKQKKEQQPLQQIQRQQTMESLTKTCDGKTDLKDYVDCVEKMGYPDDAIKRKLVQRDWDADTIVRIMDEVKRNKPQ